MGDQERAGPKTVPRGRDGTAHRANQHNTIFSFSNSHRQWELKCCSFESRPLSVAILNIFRANYSKRTVWACQTNIICCIFTFGPWIKSEFFLKIKSFTFIYCHLLPFTVNEWLKWLEWLEWLKWLKWLVWLEWLEAKMRKNVSNSENFIEIYQVRNVYWTGIWSGPHVTQSLVLPSHVWTISYSGSLYMVYFSISRRRHQWETKLSSLLLVAPPGGVMCFVSDKVRDAEWAIGLERAPPVCVQLEVSLEASALNRWLTPRP